MISGLDPEDFDNIKEKYILANAEATNYTASMIDAKLKNPTTITVIFNLNSADETESIELQSTLSNATFAETLNATISKKGSDFLPDIQVVEVAPPVIEKKSGKISTNHDILIQYLVYNGLSVAYDC